MAAADLTLCPDCGRSIPRDAVRGMCMACMMRSVVPGLLSDGSDLSDESDPSDTFGPWRVLSAAGEGAFGLVYEAEQHTPLHRRAALKVLKPGLSSREVLARFAAEREALAVLDHPGIARVLDAGDAEGRPWFAAEWVDGAQSITAFCQNENLPRRERVRLFQSVCEAVAHAHQRGIIHRDLKPSNILVSALGAAKVIDFGIARATEQVPAQSTLATLAGQVLGTPAYMSPEQAAGRGAEADTRSDIYSLGAVLYELLTGQPPFPRTKLESSGIHETLRIVREDSPERPSSLDPSLRGELEWIILRALEKEPARRYETAAAFSRDLGHWLDGGTVLAVPPSRAYQLRTFLRRHRAAAIGVAAVFVALLAGLAGTTLMFLRAREQSARAETNEAAARRNASRGDHQTAQTFFDKGQPVTAVMHLARAVRTDPTNHAAAERLLAELVWTDFPRLAHPPAEMPEFIRDAGFSPDGKRLAVKCNEVVFEPGFVALFDPETGARLGTETLPGSGVHHFAFSPDGKSIALCHAGGAVTFWQPANGMADTSIAVLAHENQVRRVTWITADRLATVEDTGEKTSTGRLWELSTRRVLMEITGLQALAAPAVSPDNSRIAWMQNDGTVSVHELSDGQGIAAWTTPGHGAAAFAGGSDRLAVQTYHEKLRLFRVRDGTLTGDPMQASNAGLPPVVSPDGSAILTTGFDGIATLWETATQKPRPLFEGRFMLSQFSAHGSMLVLGGDFHTDVRFLDLDRFRPARAPIPVAGNPTTLALSPDGRWLATGGRQRRLMFYDLRPRAARPEILPFAGNLWHAAWSADGTFLAALGTNGQCAAWDAAGQPIRDAPWTRASRITHDHAAGLRKSRTIADGDPSLADMVLEIHRRDLPPKVLLSAALSPAGNKLALGTSQHEVRVFDFSRAEARPLMLTLPRSPQQLAFSGDSHLLAAGLTDGTVFRMDLTSGAETGRWQAHTTKVTALAFLPDGRIASGAEGKGVAISPPGTRVMVSAPVRQLAVSPDGKWITAGLADSSALLFDTATGKATGPPMRHRSVTGPAGLLLRFSPDSRTLATAGSHDNTVRLWHLPSATERAVLPHPNRVEEFTFDSTGRRLATVCMEQHSGALRVWDVASALPLMPPCIMPAGNGFMSVAFHPDSTRAVVCGWRGAVLIYDLPPLLTEAPAWLSGAAGTSTGWHFDASGLPAPVPPAPPARDTATITPWMRWLAAPLESRPVSPLASQSRDDFISALRGLRTIEALREINQFHPSPADAVALKALQLLTGKEP